MSFQKDRRLSVSTKVPKNFARTPPPAFLFPDQRFQRPGPEEPAGLFSAGPRRRRLFSCLSFRCQAVLFKELSFHQTAPGRSGGGGYLVRADLLVNRAFQPFCFFRNRSFEGRSKPPGKPRGYPSTQSSDSIEARKLTDPTNRSKKLFQTLAPIKTPKTPSPKPVGPARLRARRRYTSPLSDWQ